MLLKRLYDPASIEAGAPRVVGVDLIHTGTTPFQNFSPRFVVALIGMACARIDGDVLSIITPTAVLRYTIARKPGYYCCHDGAPMPLSPEAYGDPALAAIEARQWLIANGFDGVASPDPQNPSGYQRVNQYECVLDADQHAQFKAVSGALAPSMNQQGA